MKFLKNIKFATILLAPLVISSCSKEDLFEEPYANVSPGAAFETPARIEKAAIGMYNRLQDAEYLGGRILIYADIRGADVNPPTYFGNMSQYNVLTAADGTVRNAWIGGYRTIYEANLFMQNLEANRSKVDAVKADQYIGEGKFIRALSYFYLVNLWAQPYNFSAGATHLGVPLVLSATADPFGTDNLIPRSTVAEVYNQMELDLLDAEAKLPDEYGDPAFSNIARATKAAARGLLMRLYLYKGDYSKAVTYSNLIIGGKYVLNAEPATTFTTDNSAEAIFSIAHNGADNPNTNNALGQHYSPTNRGDITVNPAFLSLMDNSDKRKTSLITVQNGSSYSGKYTTVSDWVPILRYAEVLLTKAEALANLAPGNTVDAEALRLVNEVHRRSSTIPVVALTKSDLIAAILLERRIELAFEGQGIMEYLRTGRAIPAHGIVTSNIAWGSDYVVLPIPQYDIEKNSKLEQNKGY